MGQIIGITLDVAPGERIESAVAEAIKTATINLCPVRFEFNGITISVTSMSQAEDVARWWWEIGEARAKASGASITPGGIRWGDWGR